VLPGSTAWAVRHVPGPLPVVFFVGLLLGTVASIAAATVTFLLVEHPFLELRRAIMGRGARVPAASPATPVKAA
jgi:peptidoglycan/LPS O-acetylase OafA/YrhL